MNIVVHTDGGARGNPGPAAVGVVIELSHTVIEFGKRIGEATNNVAEYTAVIEALRHIKDERPRSDLNPKEKIEIDFYVDSNLVVQQLNGRFKVKDPTLRELLVKVRLLEAEIGGEVRYAVVSREENSRADFLVNQALDDKSY